MQASTINIAPESQDKSKSNFSTNFLPINPPIEIAKIPAIKEITITSIVFIATKLLPKPTAKLSRDKARDK